MAGFTAHQLSQQSYAPMSRHSQNGWESSVVSVAHRRNKNDASRVQDIDIPTLLGRPSALSTEYDEVSRNQGVSIANILERQAWEKRRGISDEFDPARRGYAMPRDNNEVSHERDNIKTLSVGNQFRSRSPSGEYRRNHHAHYERCGDPRSNSQHRSSTTNRHSYREGTSRNISGGDNDDRRHHQSWGREDETDGEKDKRRRNNDSYSTSHFADRNNDVEKNSFGHKRGENRQRNDDQRGRQDEFSVRHERQRKRDFVASHETDRQRSLEELPELYPKPCSGNHGGDSNNDRLRRHDSESINENALNLITKEKRHTRSHDRDRNEPLTPVVAHGKDETKSVELDMPDQVMFRRGYDDIRTKSNANDNEEGKGKAQWETVSRRSRKSHRSTSAESDDGDESVDEQEWAPRVSLIPRTELNGNFERFMLMMVGIPGSGKSLFAMSLEKAMPWKYQRINQDLLGSRLECEYAARRALAGGKCPIIDRCNFSVEQRKSFIDIAKDFDVPVECVVLNVPIEECVRRCENRKNHETVKPAKAREVVQRMALQFSPPLPYRVNMEQFKAIKHVTDLTSFNDAVLEYLNQI